MSGQRQRVIFYFENQKTLEAIKKITGKSAQLIAANDIHTVEAAIRLYNQVDVIVAERTTPAHNALTILKYAEQIRPAVNRVMLANPSAMVGVYEALHAGTIQNLLFWPGSPEQIADALGLPSDSTAGISSAA